MSVTPLQALTDALRWYAKDERYYGHDPDVLPDRGSRARAALDALPAPPVVKRPTVLRVKWHREPFHPAGVSIIAMRLFAGPDVDHFQLAGTLKLNGKSEWPILCAALELGGIEVVHDVQQEAP